MKRNAADRFNEQGAWVSILALAETAWVLRTGYKRNAAEVATAIDLLIHHRDLVLQDPDLVEIRAKAFPEPPLAGVLRLPDGSSRPESRPPAARHLRPLAGARRGRETGCHSVTRDFGPLPHGQGSVGVLWDRDFPKGLLHFCAASSLVTLNAPGTPLAAMPARFLSPSLSTTPTRVMFPFFTMM